MRRRAPPGTPPFLHSPRHSASCNSLILDKHERPTEAEMLAIFKTLPNTNIQALHMLGVPLSIDIVVHLSAFIANSKLKLLHLVDLDNLGDAGFMILAESMRKNVHLETVILANMYHAIGTDSGHMFASLLRTHPTLNHIDFRGFKGGSNLINVILAGLRNTNMKSICLRQIGLNVTGLRAIARLLPISSLQHLDLSGNKLGDDGARIVAQRILSRNSTLKELDLSGNDITDLGAGDIAVALENDEHLLHLMLTDNIGITEDGIVEFNEILIDPSIYGNQKLLTLALTAPRNKHRKKFLNTLKDLQYFLDRNLLLLSKNPNGANHKRKHWPHEGSVSGEAKRLIGINGKNEFIGHRKERGRMREKNLGMAGEL